MYFAAVWKVKLREDPSSRGILRLLRACFDADLEPLLLQVLANPELDVCSLVSLELSARHRQEPRPFVCL
jgi:hypothetical protein